MVDKHDRNTPLTKGGQDLAIEMFSFGNTLDGLHQHARNLRGRHLQRNGPSRDGPLSKGRRHIPLSIQSASVRRREVAEEKRIALLLADAGEGRRERRREEGRQEKPDAAQGLAHAPAHDRARAAVPLDKAGLDELGHRPDDGLPALLEARDKLRLARERLRVASLLDIALEGLEDRRVKRHDSAKLRTSSTAGRGRRRGSSCSP